jgi:hypothetical protein
MPVVGQKETFAAKRPALVPDKPQTRNFLDSEYSNKPFRTILTDASRRFIYTLRSALS